MRRVAREIAERRGRVGEDLAAEWLEARGWTVVARRLRTKVGEIDLVARRNALTAFVEVKTRARLAALDEAIDERRLARVAAAAALVWTDWVEPGGDGRIDVILLAPGVTPRHIENAWVG